MEPPTVIGPATKKATRPSNQLPKSLVEGAKIPKRDVFGPPPGSIYAMEQISLKGHGMSPHEATEPFPLFAEEAIAQMRAEIFDKKVLAESILLRL